MIDCNEWRTEKRHECANMGKVKRHELWWQLYSTSFPVWDSENFRPMDFCWHECTTPEDASLWGNTLCKLTNIQKCWWSSGSVIGIATTLRSGRPGVRFPVRAKHSTLLQNVKTGTGTHPILLQWVLGFFPWSKVVGAWSVYTAWTSTTFIHQKCWYSVQFLL